MITKAIVKKTCTPESNYYYVYIPVLRKANDSEEDATLKATRIQLSGSRDDLNVGDVVFVGFEDTEYGKPIILGKLYTGDEEEVSANQTLRALNVTDKAQLPGDTTIGDTSIDQLKDFVNENTVHKQEELLPDKLQTGVLSQTIGFDSDGNLKKGLNSLYFHSMTIILRTENIITHEISDKIIGDIYLTSLRSTPYTKADLVALTPDSKTLPFTYIDFETNKVGYTLTISFSSALLFGQYIVKANYLNMDSGLVSTTSYTESLFSSFIVDDTIIPI